MPRIARLTYPGGFYHLYNRGLKFPIFKKDTDYHKLLDKLSSLSQKGDWIIYAYCLMPTHYHLLIEEKNIPIAKLMGRLFTSLTIICKGRYKARS